MKTIYITKKNGNISAYKNSLEKILDLIPNGQHTIKVTKDNSKRTTTQNALFWMWMEHISQETSIPCIDLHDYFCKKYLQRQVKIHKHIETVVGGTSNLTREEFNIFMEKVREETASEFGIVLPDPDDHYFTEFRDHYNQFITA